MEAGEWMILNLDNYNDTKHKQFLENISDSTLELSFKSFSSFYEFLSHIGEYNSSFLIQIKDRYVYCRKDYYSKRYVLRYNNIKLHMDDMKCEFTHLRKDNKFEMKNEDNLILFPWHLFYKEIIRVCDRDNKTSIKKKILHQAKNFKLMSLHGELDNDNITALKYSDTSLYYASDDFWISVYISKEDKTLKINEEQRYDLRLDSINFEDITYEQLKIKLIAAFMLFGKDINDKNE